METLVSQKTQSELQTREQKQVAEINQAQSLKLLHSCNYFSPFSHTTGPHVSVLQMIFDAVCASSLLSSVGGSFTLVTAVKRNKDTGLRRSLDSPNPDVAALIETRVLFCLNSNLSLFKLNSKIHQYMFSH